MTTHKRHASDRSSFPDRGTFAWKSVPRCREDYGGRGNLVLRTYVPADRPTFRFYQGIAVGIVFSLALAGIAWVAGRVAGVW